MLQAVFPDLVGPLLGRLREWTVVLRGQGARMLHALLLRVGAAGEDQLPLLLAALRAAAGDTPSPCLLCLCGLARPAGRLCGVASGRFAQACEAVPGAVERGEHASVAA